MTQVNGLLWNLLLALMWAAVTGVFSLGNLALGFAGGFIILLAIRNVAGIPNYFHEFCQVISLIGYFLWQLTLANLRVAWDVVTPRHRMKPGIVAVPLDTVTDAEITLLAGLINLTPGTIAVDVSTDRKVMYVHAMYINDPDTVARNIKSGFERRLLNAIR